MVGVNAGCNGGLMEKVWEYQRDAGIIEYDDYPYTSGTKNAPGVCEQNQHPKISTTVDDWDWVPNFPGQKDVLLNNLQRGPISIAVNASQLDFYYSGIMSYEDCGGH